MTPIPVVSSNLKSVAYDEATSELHVEFMSGIGYAYEAVPKRVALALTTAPSAGKYLNAEIKSRFKVRRLR